MLFIPLSFLAMLLFERPISVLVGSLMLTSGIELLQAVTEAGRACSYDDVKANSLGAILGLIAGTVTVWARRRRIPFSRKDSIRGVVVGAAGAIALITAFSYAVNPINTEAESKQRRSHINDMQAQDSWLQETVHALFGQNAEVGASATKRLNNGHYRMEAETTQGNIVALWPEKKIQSFSVHLKDAGTPATRLSAKEIRTTGDHFAEKWFPEGISESKVTFQTLGQNSAGYLASYRRYVNDVMMPMRLDLTITAAGKVVGMAARSVPDPDLPKVTITEDAAKKQAEQGNANMTAKPVKLLAQKVHNIWRPVWMVGLSTSPGQKAESTAFIDAVSGHEVTPDPIDNDGEKTRPQN
ncbi:VanZ family protein [Streptomyces sp. DB-54]